MKLLIVDDSKFSQMIAEKHMKELFKDIEITFANNGEEGFNKYKELHPDYVFIDLLMPIINGQELVRLIKEYDKDSKIFVVSADVQKTVKKEMEGYGIMGFINKPFDEEKSQLVFEAIEGDKNGPK